MLVANVSMVVLWKGGYLGCGMWACMGVCVNVVPHGVEVVLM